MDTITHLAGPAITVGNRLIQRCSLCGAMLSDLGQVCIIGDSKPLKWETGRLIQVEAGNPTRSSMLPDADQLPKDNCLDQLGV